MKDLITGKDSLISAFWLLGVAYFIVATGLITLSILIPNIVIVAISYFLIFLFFIVYEISVWNCSKNSNRVGWTLIAKTIVLSRALAFFADLYFQAFTYDNSENPVNTYALLFEIALGLIGSIVFLTVKMSGGELKKPYNISSSPDTTNQTYLNDAKSKFLSGEYEAAFSLFTSASSLGELDALSKSYMDICKRRIAKN